MSLINREKLCVNREKIGTKNPPFFSPLAFHRLRLLEKVVLSKTGRFLSKAEILEVGAFSPFQYVLGPSSFLRQFLALKIIIIIIIIIISFFFSVAIFEDPPKNTL